MKKKGKVNLGKRSMSCFYTAMFSLLVLCTPITITNAEDSMIDSSASASPGVKAACTDLVLDYALYRDRLDAQAYANLFTEDAVVTIMGEVFNGREALRARLIAGRDGPVTRHMMSTIRIFQQSEDRASGVSYVAVYGAQTDDFPTPVKGFLGLGEYHDRFEKTADGWKISRRTFVPVFTQPD